VAWCRSRAAISHLDDHRGLANMNFNKGLSLRETADTPRQASAPAPGDLAGQELGNLLNGQPLGNVNWGEALGAGIGGATGGGIVQYLDDLAASAGLGGTILDWGTDVIGGNFGLFGGLLGGEFGNPADGSSDGSSSDGSGSGGNGSASNGSGGSGSGGCSLAARKCR
jgi:hypothetical protein